MQWSGRKVGDDGIAMVDRNTTGRELERLHAAGTAGKGTRRNLARL
jgi:hypothetical protein